MKLDQLKPIYLSQAGKLLTDCFFNDFTYSWGRALGETKVDRLSYYINEMHLPEVLKDSSPPSPVALTDDGKQVIGILTLENFKKSDEEYSKQGEETQTQPIPAILNTCHTIFWNELAQRKHENKVTCGEICYFAFLGVSSEHRRQRIGEHLVIKGVENAKIDGYRIGLAFCTSPKSRALFEKLGFESWGEVVYKDFKLPSDGSIPFASIPDSTTVMCKYL
jgi:GNAT superfamily N-acetyltransferase